jgi:hypothetical protein
VECWQDGKLVGGLYGAKIGAVLVRLFSGVTDASRCFGPSGCKTQRGRPIAGCATRTHLKPWVPLSCQADLGVAVAIVSAVVQQIHEDNDPVHAEFADR